MASMCVGFIMETSILAFDASEDVGRTVGPLARTSLGVALVLEGGQYAGVVHPSDVARSLSAGRKGTVAAVMRRWPAIEADCDVFHAAGVLLQDDRDGLVVVWRGAAVGWVSRTSVFQTLLNLWGSRAA